MKSLHAIMLGGLMTAALSWPSEGAINGDGLHLAICWTIAAAIVLFNSKWTGFSSASGHIRWLAPTAILCLWTGIWLSTWYVFRIHGDRRAALNLAFEWTALLAGWIIARQAYRSLGAKFVLGLLVSIGTGAAVLGIVQHHYIYPQQRQWYLQQREKIQAATALGPGGIMVQAETESLLRQMDIPLYGPERDLFERRLLDSSEPTGPFALANSLGGLLAVIVVLVSAALAYRIGHEDRINAGQWFVAIGLILVAGYCLVLCKTRTAWVGVLAGIVTLILQYRGQNLLRRFGRILLAGMALVVLLFGVGIGTGALDREVIVESPRSLQFRLFYWLGSAGVIRESPVFGAGPGNFRQAYLKHKPDESSEEILDPHNVFIDSWTSAGLTGVAGLTLLLVSVFVQFRRANSLSDDDGTNAQSLEIRTAPSMENPNSLLTMGIGAGAAFHFLWLWGTGGGFENPMVPGPLGWTSGIWLVPVTALITGPLVTTVLAESESLVVPCLAALLVHLCGAGGLQITGVMLVLLTLHAAIGSIDRERLSAGMADGGFGRPMPKFRVGAAVFFLFVAASIALWGLKPTFVSRQMRSLASMQQVRGESRQAEKTLWKAVSADQISVDSHQQLTELLAYELIESSRQVEVENPGVFQNSGQISELYRRADRAANGLVGADLRRWAGYHLRGQIRLGFAKVANDSHLEELAVIDFYRTLELYPSNARLWAEVAIVCSESSRVDEAEAAAQRALELEQVNQEWGHADRYLDPEIVGRLNEIAR